MTNSEEPPRGRWGGVAVLAFAIVVALIAGLLGWQLIKLSALVVVIALVIWQACEPFADAAQWIGQRFHLPGSVRGATLDAIASSLPELFTGVFFVLVFFFSDAEEAGKETGEGIGATVATCAGSAVYNMILIPAAVAIVISYRRSKRPTVDVEDKVIARDGVAYLLTQIVLLWFLYLNYLDWWMAIVFLGMYAGYTSMLYFDWQRFETIKLRFLEQGHHTDAAEVHAALAADGVNVGLSAVRQVQDELVRGSDVAPEERDEAQMVFGFFRVALGPRNVWMIVAASTLVAASACYYLVEVTRQSADVLGVPVFFVAVIVAAAASSVPDTFLSIGAALRGDDSGAVSNAFGSNIFDICICLAVPLLINSYLNDWQPIPLLSPDGSPMRGLVGLRVLLGVLTVLTLVVMWHNRQLTRRKAWFLCVLYGVFIAYAVVGSLGLMDL